MIRNTPNQYGSISQLLHWSIGILIIWLLVLGLVMGDLDDSIRGSAYMIHKSTGLVVLILVVLRMVWALNNVKPSLPYHAPAWEKCLAKLTHLCLYALMFSIPLTGWLMSSSKGYHPSFYGYGKVAFPGIEGNTTLNTVTHELHSILAYAMIVLLALHIAAAVKHHFIDRDDILKRMLPGKNRRKFT